MGCDVRAMLAGCTVALALQPPGFDAACALPPGHEYVGAVVNPDTARQLDPSLMSALAATGDPWVLLSLSTTSQHGQREALQAILDGLATVPVRVLVTLGGSVVANQLDPPATSSSATNATAQPRSGSPEPVPHWAAAREPPTWSRDWLAPWRRRSPDPVGMSRLVR